MLGSWAVERLRIHGDNILECERALRLLTEALGEEGAACRWVESAAYAPRYEIFSGASAHYEVQLFPGYGRWGFGLEKYLQERRAHVREKTDAIVTRLHVKQGGALEEVPLVAFEFCGSLPAGNNAWQRCGRALATAAAGIPYLYFAEIGGIELDEERNPKAPRWPNPLVPFAYITLGRTLSVVAMPVFSRSPSVDEEVARPFDSSFGMTEARELVRLLLKGGDTRLAVENLEKKATKVVEVLAAQRRRGDGLRGGEWRELAGIPGGGGKARWFLNKGLVWRKKLSVPVTKTFQTLLEATAGVGCVGVGSGDIPICLIGRKHRADFDAKIAEIYGQKISQEFRSWIADSGKPLVCIWVAGFKPRGDDSRPDRGLVPLGRMLFGFGAVDVLTVVYGPAKRETWNLLVTDMATLARENGLWEAIIGLSGGILVDSRTSSRLQSKGFVISPPVWTGEPGAALRGASEVPRFGEQDVDSTLHLIFSEGLGQGVFESMCNPPGGDWSGLAYYAFKSNQEFRWTSLPRVSRRRGKRPDHVVEFLTASDRETMLSIESKDSVQTLEAGVGHRLAKYVEDLLRVPPTAARLHDESSWRPHKGLPVSPQPSIVSGAAFRFSSLDCLKRALKEGQVDVVLGVEFLPSEERVVVHVVSDADKAWVGEKFVELAKRFGGRVKVEIH